MSDFYQRHLRSEAWATTRRHKLDDARHRCELCYWHKRLNVHHKTYKRLGREWLADLIVLCEPCHVQFHGKLVPQRDNAVILFTADRGLYAHDPDVFDRLSNEFNEIEFLGHIDDIEHLLRETASAFPPEFNWFPFVVQRLSQAQLQEQRKKAGAA